MKRVLLLMSLVLAVSMIAAAGQKKEKQAAQQPAPAPTPTPLGKVPPQAKTQDEFKAYGDTSALQDAAAIEQAADDFAAKFPASELRYLLYYRAMFAYQGQNDADKAVEMGQKVLTLAPDEPVSLAMVAAMISERTRETDLDRDERLNEAMKDAQRSLEKLDTELVIPLGTPVEQAEQNKRMVRSTAYAAIGNVHLAKKNYPEAEKNFKLSIDAVPENPDAITLLRYTISLDQQKKYAEALPVANRAVQLAPPGTPQAAMAKQERDRLTKLVGAPATGAAPAPGSAPAATASPSAPAQPQTPVSK